VPYSASGLYGLRPPTGADDFIAQEDDIVNERALVTGCCGYIGAWITLELARAGWRVRGTSREPGYARELIAEALAARPDGDSLRDRVEVVPGELLDASSWRGAADGCAAVVHTACPVATEVGTPREKMHDPALVGTENVLREAARAGGVRRVVYLSSIVTLLDHHRPLTTPRAPRECVGPDDWNETATPATDPYAHAKVLTERRARALVSELLPGAQFASVLPGPVAGPPIGGTRVPASVHKMLWPLLDGQLRFGSVDMTVGLVDVRDVAAAVVALLGLAPERLAEIGARARFVCVARPSPRIHDLADVVRANFEPYAKWMPRRAIPLPRWLLLAVMRLSVTREAHSYSRAMMGRRVEYDATLTEETLGVRFRSPRDTVVETVDWLLRRGLHTPPRA